jgi:outer membrane lipoprotein-sorting protein
MRRTVCVTAAVLLAWSPALAEQPAEMKALVEKAIKAAGGAENLAKFKGESFKGKGKWYGMGDGLDFTGEWWVERPGKVRVQIDAGADGNKFTFIRVVNGKKVWNKFADMTQAVEDKEQIAEAEEETHASRLTSLLPLLEKGYKLAPVGEVKVEGKPAIGVRVSHKGHRDVNLFFDKESGLLVKSEGSGKDFMAGGKEFTQETLYSQYKEVKGLKVPMKVVINRDGKKYVETEVTEIEPKEKLDDSLFEKP